MDTRSTIRFRAKDGTDTGYESRVRVQIREEHDDIVITSAPSNKYIRAIRVDLEEQLVYLLKESSQNGTYTERHDLISVSWCDNV